MRDEHLIARAQAVVDGKEPHDGAGIARMLEDEIERRGMQMGYTTYLADIVGVHRSSWGNKETLLVIPWLLLRAAPEQRARAFLEAVKE